MGVGEKEIETEGEEKGRLDDAPMNGAKAPAVAAAASAGAAAAPGRAAAPAVEAVVAAAAAAAPGTWENSPVIVEPSGKCLFGFNQPESRPCRFHCLQIFSFFFFFFFFFFFVFFFMNIHFFFWNLKQISPH